MQLIPYVMQTMLTLYSRLEIFCVSSAARCVFSASLILAIMSSSFMRDSRSAY